MRKQAIVIHINVKTTMLGLYSAIIGLNATKTDDMKLYTTKNVAVSSYGQQMYAAYPVEFTLAATPNINRASRIAFVSCDGPWKSNNE